MHFTSAFPLHVLGQLHLMSAARSLPSSLGVSTERTPTVTPPCPGPSAPIRLLGGCSKVPVSSLKGTRGHTARTDVTYLHSFPPASSSLPKHAAEVFKIRENTQLLLCCFTPHYSRKTRTNPFCAYFYRNVYKCQPLFVPETLTVFSVTSSWGKKAGS